MKKQIIIPEADWDSLVYKTKEWEDSVDIVTWEHDYEKKQYVIIYREK